jgi:hypothetical protein
MISEKSPHHHPCSRCANRVHDDCELYVHDVTGRTANVHDARAICRGERFTPRFRPDEYIMGRGSNPPMPRVKADERIGPMPDSALDVRIRGAGDSELPDPVRDLKTPK